MAWRLDWVCSIPDSQLTYSFSFSGKSMVLKVGRPITFTVEKGIESNWKALEGHEKKMKK